jgi:hypothetical protein
MRMLNEVNPPLEDTLEHFGVKGMHWGHRKARAEAGTPSKRDIRKANRAAKSDAIYKARRDLPKV